MLRRVSKPVPVQSRPTTASTRPWTNPSRPTTARPATTNSTRNEGSYVISILEGRGIARQVGFAALDRDTGKVILIQLADCQTYVKTLHQMHLHHPSLILVPDTFLSANEPSSASATTSLLVQYIQEEFSNVPIEPVARKYWNESNGLSFIDQLCVEDDERAATLISSSNKYYALSAVCALFKHVEIRLNTRFSPHSLRIRYSAVEGTMMIDLDTTRNLELISNLTHKKSSYTLFGTLNHTYTPMASRLLRVNILSPVIELIQTEEKFTDIRDALKTLSKLDFDKIIASLTASESHPTSTAKLAASRVAQMLSLRSIVKNLPNLHSALNGSKSQLLQIIRSMISDERLSKIEEAVRANLNEDSVPLKGGIGAVNARVYAVKANRNRLLDVARETFKENVNDIHQLNRDLGAQHNLPLSLVYQETGFVLSLKKIELEGELPRGFINPTVQKGRWLFSSIELKKMNARMKDALDETLILSDKVIHDLLTDILEDVGALYKASEAVALLDMLWSFAHVSIMHNYVRPEFTGTLAIKAGRHPILENVKSSGTMVPNDVYCCESSSFQIIQGPNMSGKSTYLRQIGLLTVMAMCGCFVPAEYASFRIHDVLLTRLSNDDDMENSLSTFAKEMASSAMILGLATPNSMILIDELGRGTSPREGVGISHAIAESLIASRASVFFATSRHFSELATTLSRRPTVVNLHLSVQKTRQTSASFGMLFQYKVIDGVQEDMEHYGLELARLADLPSDVMTEGKRIAAALKEQELRRAEDSRTNKISIRRKALLKLKTQLAQALDHSTLPDDEFVTYISRFQMEIAKVLHDTLQ